VRVLLSLQPCHRLHWPLFALALCLLSWGALEANAVTKERNRGRPPFSRQSFCRDMPKAVRADHPAIVPLADAIRRITTDPREQLIIVHDVSHLLIDYDSDERVYGQSEFHATLDEMIARRRQAGWVYLRDDCDGRAVFAAHLLAALEIPWRLEASYWKRHAWISARVGGVTYDLLDLRPGDRELNTLSYKLIGRHFSGKSRMPPYFHWRRAWLERTGGDLAIGLRLGLLELESRPGLPKERFSTDWLKKHPEGHWSPLDPRMQTAPYAAFPFQEKLTWAGSVADLGSASNEGRRAIGLSGSP
jgi:hypothetical protein